MNFEGESLVCQDVVEIVEINDDDEPPVTVSHSAKSSKAPLWTQSSNGYTKPRFSFPQLITKALAVCPNRRATALRICDLIADMQPYYKYTSANWKPSVYSSLMKNTNVFVISETNENNEYIWGFHPNWEKYLMDGWLPKYLKKMGKLGTLTDSIVESEILTSSSTVDSSNTKSSLIDGSDILRKTSYSLCRQSSINSTSHYPVAETTQLATEGFLPVSTLILQQNVTSHNSDLNEVISKPEAETRYATESSSSERVPEFALADPDKVEDYEPDEINHSSNPLEPEVTVSGNLLDFETMRAVSSITDMGKAENQEIPHQTSDLISTDFSLNNLHHPQNVSLSNEEAQYRVQFHKVHPFIEKFRIHCTVCDTHLGTAGLMAQENVRFHASLGVLTCRSCHNTTKYISQLNDACHWCSRNSGGTQYFCSICPFKFCETCIDKNFGVPMRIRMTENKAWLCFLCHKKQIWPHRAVAYFLLSHYEELRKMKNRMNLGCYKNSEPPFFLKDLSTCCKKLTASNTSKKVTCFGYKPPITRPPPTSLTSVQAPPVTSTELRPSSALQAGNQQMLIVGKPHENQVVVQTTTCVSSLTVNTGTQYIHNIYPGKNCVFQPSTTNTQCAGTVASQEMSKRSDPNDFFIDSNFLPTYDNNIQVIHNHSVSEDVNDDISIHTDPHLIKQSSTLMALQDKIQKKPMPKSKKQSLLRAVLMNESIESMKKQLQVNDLNPLNSCPDSFGSSVPNEGFYLNPNINDVSHCTDQNSEEPILKSIIQTATERLVNLKKKPVPFENIYNSNQPSLLKNVICDSDENYNLNSKSKPEKLPNQIPKIKVRSVEELQGRKPNYLVREDELKDLNESNNKFNSDNVDSNKIPRETNVTGLKQSIIEASRTLVSTQKKFKELAKVISDKLTVQTQKAAEMVTTFQDILKVCQKQIDVIDNNITSQYSHIVLQRRKPAESVRAPTYEVMSKSKALNLEKQKQKMKKIHFSRTVSVPVNDVEEDVVENISNKSSNRTVKRKRGLIDFNPLDKVIFGTPEITQEDIEEVNTTVEDKCNQKNDSLLTQLTQKQLYLRNLKKRKNVWSYKSRKRAHNKRDMIKRRMRHSNMNESNETEYEGNFVPKMQSEYTNERLRKRKMKSCRPLRSSDRKHPSSAAFAASMFKEHESVSRVWSPIPVECIIKPCSVIVHKLDTRIVELMEKRVKNLQPVNTYMDC